WEYLDHPQLGPEPLGVDTPIALSIGKDVVFWWGNKGFRYSPRDNTWYGLPTPTGNAVPIPGQTLVWTGALMVVWGGQSDTGARYDFSSWSAAATMDGSPAPRFGHTAVWTGNRMIVWGGRSETPIEGAAHSVLSTGSMYDAVLDTWTPTAAMG